MTEVLDYTRLSDAVDLANFLANLPFILPELAPGRANLDLSSEFLRPRTCIIGGRAGAILMQHLDGPDEWADAFGAHFLLTPQLRGKKALDFCRDVADIMFTMRGASLIAGAIPVGHRGSRVMTRALGGTPIGESIDAYGRRCINYVMERVRWVQLQDQRYRPGLMSEPLTLPKLALTTPKVLH